MEELRHKDVSKLLNYAAEKLTLNSTGSKWLDNLREK